MRLDHLLSREASRGCITVDLPRANKILVAIRPGETPVPIPNTMVKTRTADGTVLETIRESRWLPEQWGLSSAGRAPALQAGGREFESLSLHDGSSKSALQINCQRIVNDPPYEAVCACTKTDGFLSVYSANARDEIVAKQL